MPSFVLWCLRFFFPSSLLLLPALTLFCPVVVLCTAISNFPRRPDRDPPTPFITIQPRKRRTGPMKRLPGGRGAWSSSWVLWNAFFCKRGRGSKPAVIVQLKTF
ncbi:hypothetical protein M440DRAFT_1406035 [Trichoderma longibrachiatum ATCC 18648]|uniref:Uncharacterized protein n=1 Tax=Trichoderma longibrachiatum ATCC 18648 TaxID=983965 RepID=A0A2T4BRQ0_TRILO|nr:hypothetical protein M440DRAFT_1406035 [Trichoderma longibrachiatum ATCC 18648]